MTTKGHDDAHWLFSIDDVHHIFVSERFEIEAIAGVVIGGNCFRIAVHHDGFESGIAQSKGSVNAAVIEFDSLADSIWSGTENNDLLAIRRRHLVGVLPCRVVIWGLRIKFGCAGIDRLVSRHDAKFETTGAHFGLGAIPKPGQLGIGETQTLCSTPAKASEVVEPHFGKVGTFFRDRTHLVEEPWIDSGGGVDLVDGLAATHHGFELEDSIWSTNASLRQEFIEWNVVVFRLAGIAIQTKATLLKRSQSLLQ